MLPLHFAVWLLFDGSVWIFFPFRKMTTVCMLSIGWWIVFITFHPHDRSQLYPFRMLIIYHLTRVDPVHGVVMFVAFVVVWYAERR